MASVELNGTPCTSAALTVPGVGLWVATLAVPSALALSVGAVASIKFLDVTWTGAVVAGGVADGSAHYRVVAGKGKWGVPLPPRAYANDAGLSAAQLLRDVATEAGEQIDSPPGGTLGPHFNRPRLPASFALNLLAPRAWFARPDGVVTFGARPALPASTLPVLSRNPAVRVVELGVTGSVAGLLPGMATEFGTCADVDLELTPDGIRARLYAAPAFGRRIQALARLLDALDPGRRFRGSFEYRISTQEGERLNLQPVRSRSDLPDLARVPVRAGLPGVKATYAPGAQVVVTFLDGDPTRPAVVGFDDPGQPGWPFLTMTIGGPDPAFGVAYQGAPVQAGPFAGAITLGSLRVGVVV